MSFADIVGAIIAGIPFVLIWMAIIYLFIKNIFKDD